MKLSIREMIDGGVARLRYTFRYSTSRVEHPESVAEHSYFVAFYCMLIAEWYKYNAVPVLSKDEQDAGLMVEEELNETMLLKKAIMHDLEEARSGDFPRNFKHSSPELKQILDVAAERALIQLIEPLLEEPSGLNVGSVPNHVDRLIHYWTDAKDQSLEGRILEFADYLAVLGFLLQEGAHDGNRVIKQHVAEMNKYMAKFERPAFDFIRSLVQQASVLTRTIM